VEVTAAGMTQPARSGITANPITITNFQVDDSDLLNLKVSWEFDSDAPAGGWLLTYTIDGNGQPQVVQCEDSSGVVEVRVPSATYEFTIQAADGSTVFQNTHTYDTPAPTVYRNNHQAFFRDAFENSFIVNMFKTPEKANWTHEDVFTGMYTTTFAPGDKISLQMWVLKNFYIYHEDITVLYVIRDAEGTVLTDLLAMENVDWRDDLWNGPNYHFCGLDIPNVPTEPGNYSVGIYFDGQAITSLNFTITE
jgi:hypothetical protein